MRSRVKSWVRTRSDGGASSMLTHIGALNATVEGEGLVAGCVEDLLVPRFDLTRWLMLLGAV